MGKGGLSSNARCWAFGCECNRNSHPHLRFHRFPIDPVECKEWVRLGGNSLLLLNTHQQLKTTRAFCSKHFTADQYMVHGNVLSNLIRNARPSIFAHPPIVHIPPTFLSSSTPNCENRPPVPLPASVPPPCIKSPPRLAVPVPEPTADLPACDTASSQLSPRSLLGPGVSTFPSFQLSVPSSHANTQTPICPNPVGKRKVLSDLSNNCDNVPKRRCVELPASTPLPSKQPARRLLFSGDSGLGSSGPTPGITPSRSTARVRKSVSSKYRTVLGTYNLSRSDITPKKKALVETTRSLHREVAALQRRLTAVRAHRQALIKLANSPLTSQLRAKMKTKEGAILMEAQVANSGKHRNAFRWTLEQKTLGLALFKSSRKNYNFLRKILSLPSPSTLKALMARLKFDVGKNAQYFDHLKDVVSKFSKRDRASIVMWDEVHMAKSLNYSEAQDKVIGFEDHGEGSVKNRVANKALVFMVQSLTKKWKQPVAYYFSDGDTPGELLAKLIVSVVAGLKEIGFDIRASVCDQGNNNKLAVSLLRNHLKPPKVKPFSLCAKCKKKRVIASKARKTSGLPKGEARFSRRNCRECTLKSLNPEDITYYKVYDQVNVYHFWDVPHLLKCLRTNFQTYNVEFEEGKTAKWAHLEKLRDQDGIDGTFYSIALKLTDAHLKPSKNGDKMSVSLAAQILSARVAIALRKIHDWSQGKAIPGCDATSEFIFFIDQLFDSFNGACKRRKGKALRVPLSDDSPHFEFWKQAEAKIRQWHFVNAKFSFSSHLGWLENMTSVRGLWHDLKNDLQFEYLNLRRLTQDPLENLFSAIKANGAKVPTAVQFIAGLKTAIITNLRNSGIRGANCEDDGGELLTDMNKLFRDASEKVAEGKSFDETILTDGAVEDLSKDEEIELLRLAQATVPGAGVVKQEGEVDPSDMFDVLFGDQPQRSDNSIVCLAENCSCNGVHSVDEAAGVVTVDNVGAVTQTVELRRKKKGVKGKKSDPNEELLKEKRIIAAALDKENTGLFGNRRKTTAFVSGFVVKKVLFRSVPCEACKLTLVADKPCSDHELVVALEYDDQQRLTYASKLVIDTMVSCVDIFLELMHSSFHQPHLMAIIRERILSGTSVHSVGCSEHAADVQKFFILYFCRVSIYHRCRVLNKEFAKSWSNKKTIASLKAQRRGQTKKKPPHRVNLQMETADEEDIDDPAVLDELSVDDQLLCDVLGREGMLSEDDPTVLADLSVEDDHTVLDDFSVVDDLLFGALRREEMWSETF